MAQDPDKEITFEGVCAVIGLVALALLVVFLINYVHVYDVHGVWWRGH